MFMVYRIVENIDETVKAAKQIEKTIKLEIKKPRKFS